MTLAVRIIPTLLCHGEKLVKGKRFIPWRTIGHIEQAARICGARGVDEMILLDVKATKEMRPPDLKLVAKLAESIFTPMTVGGGVGTIEQVRGLLRAGADKVAIGTAAVLHGGERFLNQCRDTVGSQAIVVAVDCQRGAAWGRNGYQKVPGTIMETVDRVVAAGAGEILLTAIEREGTMAGYDLDLIAQVARNVDVPVIAHGGCASYENMREAIAAGASAVAAGALFQFEDATPAGAARYLASRGVTVRLPMEGEHDTTA